jgi:hypothetical protein
MNGWKWPTVVFFVGGIAFCAWATWRDGRRRPQATRRALRAPVHDPRSSIDAFRRINGTGAPQ